MASSNLAAQAAFGWHEKFPLVEPVIGSSLKYWLKKKKKTHTENSLFDTSIFVYRYKDL